MLHSKEYYSTDSNYNSPYILGLTSRQLQKRVTLIQREIFSCFAAYDIPFQAIKIVEEPYFVVDLSCLCSLKLWNTFFVFRR